MPVTLCKTLLLCGLLLWGFAHAGVPPGGTPTAAQPIPPTSLAGASIAESRLLQAYALMASGRSREALQWVEKIVHDFPHFQLAQLVYGDLLTARTHPVNAFGNVPAELAASRAGALADLRAEAKQRAQASKASPRAGTIPSQFLEVSQNTRHAIAVDASRSRLYLFENRPGGLTLLGDYYTSVGKAGLYKAAQGDQRTPLGVYYITSHLDAKSLTDFYGSGALPIDYPNMLDLKRGKTGGGIWLHGTPSNQFAQPPLASDGCLVLANPDLMQVIQSVEVGSTPVIIAPKLQWVDPRSTKGESQSFDETLKAWRNAKVAGKLDQLISFYTQDFNSSGKTLAQWSGVLQEELGKVQGRAIELNNVSYLRWTDNADTMVVTFGEQLVGQQTLWSKRQYWVRQRGQWKIFFEGML